MIDHVNEQILILRHSISPSIINPNLSAGSATSMVFKDGQYPAQPREVFDQATPFALAWFLS